MGGYPSKSYQPNRDIKKSQTSRRKQRKGKTNVPKHVSRETTGDGQISGAVRNVLYDLGDPESFVIPRRNEEKATAAQVGRLIVKASIGGGLEQPVRNRDNKRQDREDVAAQQNFQQQITGSDFVSSQTVSDDEGSNKAYEIVTDIDRCHSLVIRRGDAVEQTNVNNASTAEEMIQLRNEQHRGYTSPVQNNDTQRQVTRADDVAFRQGVTEDKNSDFTFEVSCDISRQKSLVIPRGRTS